MISKFYFYNYLLCFIYCNFYLHVSKYILIKKFMVSDVNFKIKTSFKMRNSINDFLTCVGDAEKLFTWFTYQFLYADVGSLKYGIWGNRLGWEFLQHWFIHNFVCLFIHLFFVFSSITLKCIYLLLIILDFSLIWTTENCST